MDFLDLLLLRTSYESSTLNLIDSVIYNCIVLEFQAPTLNLIEREKEKFNLWFPVKPSDNFLFDDLPNFSNAFFNKLTYCLMEENIEKIFDGGLESVK